MFDPSLFESSEFLTASSVLNVVGLDGQNSEIEVSTGCFGFTFCQVPIVFRMGEQAELRIFRGDQVQPVTRSGTQLTPEESRSIFLRDGIIERIEFCFSPAN